MLRGLVAMIGTACLVLGPLADRGPARPQTFPGMNGLLAYTLSPHLWVVAPDGSGARAVTAGLPVRAFQPAWSADGNRLAFANVIVESGGIWVIGADGSGARPVTTQSTDASPAWSPDGRTIAFVRRPANDRFDRLHVVNDDGTGVRVVTADASVHVEDPEWSPDGTRIAFSDGGNVYVVNADGTGLRKLTGAGTPGELRGGRYPSWSPDGSRLIFAALSEIRVIGSDGTGNRVLVDGFREVWEVSWSPDGSRIAFVNDAGGELQEELFVMNADGSDVIRVGVDTETTLDWGPAAAAPPPPAALPPPQVGRTVNVGVVRGTVRVRVRGTRQFVTMTESLQIPVGSELDTTRGRVRLTSAAGGGRTQVMQFYQGRFVVLQPRAARPFTTLRLSGPLVCPKRRAAGPDATPPPKRRLWGSGKGRFRTKGRFASATVRGTLWLTEDRCTGTLVRVRVGRVAVRDLVQRRTVLLRAGQSYVARRR